MSFKAKILITALVVVGFDAIASILSRRLQIEYTRFMWASFLLYLVAGYWGARRLGVIYGMLLGALAGLTDASIGWPVSRMIEPFTATVMPSLNAIIIVVVLVLVTGMGAVFGLMGAGLCKLTGQTQPATA